METCNRWSPFPDHLEQGSDQHTQCFFHGLAFPVSRFHQGIYPYAAWKCYLLLTVTKLVNIILNSLIQNWTFFSWSAITKSQKTWQTFASFSTCALSSTVWAKPLSCTMTDYKSLIPTLLKFMVHLPFSHFLHIC